MNRIKDISKVGIGDGFVLLKVYPKKSVIITPDALDKKNKNMPQMDYAEVVAVGPNCGSIKTGDIVISFNSGGSEAYKWQEEMYWFVPRIQIKFYVESNNFEKYAGKDIPSELKN